MDYEEKYKKALATARKLYNMRGDWTNLEIESIFPELRESEDERIRKALIDIVNARCELYKGITKEMFLAWLEKQSTDISSFPKEQQVFMRKYVSLDKITLIKLLAERDANNAEIIESFEKQGEQNLVKHFCDCVHVGCHVNDCKRWCHSYQKEISYTDCNSNCNHYSKPINSAFNIGETITDGISTFKIVDIKDNYYIADDGERIEIYMAHRYYTTIQNMEVHKPAWSKEDDKNLEKAIWYVEKGGKLIFVKTDKLVSWLKSLKDKVQPKHEWSEEDEIHQLHAISLIEDIKDWANKDGMHSLCIERCIESIDWLKSLKPQNRWKPSDEQIQAVKEAACYSSVFSEKTIDSLISLSEQLKKLREK